MKLKFTNNYSQNPRNIMRKCGYGENVKRSGQAHYTRRLSGGEFPRFHAYLDKTDEGFQINLHLDQKSACYDGNNAHSGEYDGEVVENEGGRVKAVVEQFKI
jgi:hypothetical protein